MAGAAGSASCAAQAPERPSTAASAASGAAACASQSGGQPFGIPPWILETQRLNWLSTWEETAVKGAQPEWLQTLKGVSQDPNPFEGFAQRDTHWSSRPSLQKLVGEEATTLQYRPPYPRPDNP